MEKPIFTLVAGINGAGKSTCYRMMSPAERESLGTRINIDEMALEYGDIVVGGKAALHLKAKCFADNLSFHQETTFTGKTILKSIDDAKAKGYAVNLIYISVADVETAIERVANRVENGGHDIPTSDIIRRYPVSLRNLCEYIHKFDKVQLFDNTQEYTELFEYSNNRIVFINDELPQWAKPAIENFQAYFDKTHKI